MLHSAPEALPPAGGCAQGLGQTLRPERLADTLRDGAVSAQSGAQSGVGGAWETELSEPGGPSSGRGCMQGRAQLAPQWWGGA